MGFNCTFCRSARLIVLANSTYIYFCAFGCCHSLLIFRCEEVLDACNSVVPFTAKKANIPLVLGLPPLSYLPKKEAKLLVSGRCLTYISFIDLQLFCQQKLL